MSINLDPAPAARYVIFGWENGEQFIHRVALVSSAVRVAQAKFRRNRAVTISITEYDMSTGVGTSLFHALRPTDAEGVPASFMNIDGMLRWAVDDGITMEREMAQ